MAMSEAWPSPAFPATKVTGSLCLPSPAYGGRLCSGPTFQYQICNSEECPGPYEDFRAQQCAKRNSYYIHQNAKHSWVPYEPDDGERALLPLPPPHPWACAGSVSSPAGPPLLAKVEGQWGHQKGHCSQQACHRPL